MLIRTVTPEILGPGKPSIFKRELIVDLRAEALGRAGAIDEKARTVSFPFSSETRDVERWFGIEILDHSPQAVILDRLRAAGPLLMDHERTDMVGRVREAWLGDDRRCWSKVQFSRGARASEIFQDVVDDIRAMVSCLYRVHEMQLESTGKDGPDVYRVTKWEPYEVSFVSIAADISVGVGREAEVVDAAIAEAMENARRLEDMKLRKIFLEPHTDAAGGSGETASTPVPAAIVAPPAPQPAAAIVDPARELEIVGRERRRVSDIDAITGKVAHLMDASELGRQFKESGRTAEEFHQVIIGRLGDVKVPTITANAPKVGAAVIGMSNDDLMRYSVIKAINANLSGNWKDAGLERAASDAVTASMGREPNGFWLPYDVLAHNPLARDVASATSPGVIGTTLMAGSFIELMRNNSIVAQMGCTIMPGLVGDVDIPRQVAANTGTWIDNESYSGTDESTPTYTALNLTPKTFRIRTDITRKMLKQSTPAIEMLVRGDIAATAGLGIDAAALVGTGSNGQPQGIIGANGITVVGPISANGGALAWSHLVDLETALGNHKRLGGLAYLTNGATVGSMKKTPKHATATVGGFLIDPDGKCNGYPLHESNTVPSNLTQASGSGLSAMIFGAWPALMVGLWGGLDLEADKSGSAVADRGGVTLRGFQDVGMGIRYLGAFAYLKDILN